MADDFDEEVVVFVGEFDHLPTEDEVEERIADAIEEYVQDTARRVGCRCPEIDYEVGVDEEGGIPTLDIYHNFPLCPLFSPPGVN